MCTFVFMCVCGTNYTPHYPLTSHLTIVYNINRVSLAYGSWIEMDCYDPHSVCVVGGSESRFGAAMITGLGES